MMPRPDPPVPPIPSVAGGAGPAHVALWFVVHRLRDDSRRGACYLCGWWSEPYPNEELAQARLRWHCMSAEHVELAGPQPSPRLTIDENP